ncbi:MAG: prolipoprotein diacylglyceryl transferase [Clostridiales bacterium]|nr:prolipoprotein diacylglyceryl transferase [Clostridiales bacterium]
MGEKFDKYKKSNISFLGFTFPTKDFLMTIGVALGVLVFLVILTVCGVGISWYGVMFGLGFLVALWLSPQLMPLRGLNKDFPYTLIWWIFPLSIIGARVYFLLFDGVSQSFADWFKIWEGGLAIYGGVIGGLLGLIISCIIAKVNIIKTTDCVAPLLAIGQAFGRIGCIFGKCCYGVEVTNKALRWFPIALKIGSDYHFATNLYEAILDFVLFLVLNKLLRKVDIVGINTCAYLVGYGVIRFVLEFFRAKEQTLFALGMPVSQIVSIICVVVGVIGICTLLFVNNRKVKNNK